MSIIQRATALDVPELLPLVAAYWQFEHLSGFERARVTTALRQVLSEPQRAQGVGTRLLEVAESEFARAGCTNVSLQLARRNDAARGFYHRHAYQSRSGYELLEKMIGNG